MTPEERREMAARLYRMQSALRDVMEACEAQAEICRAGRAYRMVFAAHMVRESIRAYSIALNEFVSRAVSDEKPEDVADFSRRNST